MKNIYSTYLHRKDYYERFGWDKKFYHTVFKNEDISEHLTKKQKKQLNKIELAINSGRLKAGKKHNSYYICNEDEPYSKEVYDTIIRGELLKS